MSKRNRLEYKEPFIPDKPTANIPNSMRAELGLTTPEVFENPTPVSQLPPPPKNQTRASLLKPREPKVKFSNHDKLLGFQSDSLTFYQRSSGTISFDSFKALPIAEFDKLKAESKQIKCKDPEVMIATPQNLLEAENSLKQPPFKIIGEPGRKRFLRNDVNKATEVSETKVKKNHRSFCFLS